MTYSPPRGGRTKFGPPLRSRWPSAAYLVASLIFGAIVFYAYLGASSSSRLFAWVVGGDRDRPLPARVLAAIVVASAVATVLRTHMRGVLVSDQWIEARYLLPLGIPRARRWAWAQVRRIIVDGPHLAFELWDGRYEQLPDVAKALDLVNLIAEHARLRRIDVTSLEDHG